MDNANTTFHDIIIPSGQSLSPAISLIDNKLVGITMPAAWDTANLTFQGASLEDATYKDVYEKDGTELNYSAAASRYIVVKPSDFAGISFFKIRSGTTGTAVNQTAARTIRLIVRKY